jgi:hypothetical protein
MTRAFRFYVTFMLLLAGGLTACGGDSSSPVSVSPTASPSPQAARATATIEAPAATATRAPEATATSAPRPTQAPSPTATPEAVATIAIEGTPEFVAWTEEALELLSTLAPEWHEQVMASIETIRSVPAGSGMDVFNKVYKVGEITAYAPGFDEDAQRVWYAGTIVHDSCHSERHEQGLSYFGRESEVACLMDQKAALLLIDTGTYFSDYVQSLIDGADDPANAYWTNPDRHW